MSNKDSLGDRMKTSYENIPKIKLMRRVPVIIRLDGKAFHTFTRGFQRPFDNILVKSMQETMKYLCENIQGCKLGYCQSDEISLLLTDYENINTDAWFDYEVQKMCSIVASMATLAFNRIFWRNLNNLNHSYLENNASSANQYLEKYCKAIEKGAMFDARVFSIPKEEVCNYFIWRQQDCTRNSIQMVGQANFSHKELQGKSCNDIQDMLVLQKGINWNNYPTTSKRGSCCIKVPQKINEGTEQETLRNKWVIDNEIPVFTQDRSYIDKLVFV